jgi:class 3 adenylate cyclase
MAERPTGIVTFLFTDIEGSTRLLQRLGDDYRALLADHHRLIREAVRSCAGVEVKTEGDAFFVVFRAASDAIRAAVAAQRALAAHAWPQGVTTSVRMGIHTGEAGIVADEYVGLDIHRAARIAAAAHGGQVLVSEAVRELTAGTLPDGVSLRDLGEHRLKDLDRAEHLHQLVIEGLRADFPPIRSQTARFELLPADVSTFVGRESEVEQARSLLGTTRLLTLTGPGGTGKTRLALATARSLQGDLADGAAFVELAPISDPGLVAGTIRTTLRLTEEPGRRSVETLIDALRDREVLLVLDNFEQVLPAADIVGHLLG